MSKIKDVAVIGTGVIGTGWIIRCLAHGKRVRAYDINLNNKVDLIKEIKRTKPFIKKIYSKNKFNLSNLLFFTKLDEALVNAEFIFECVPENYNMKIKLMRHLKKFLNTKKDQILLVE